LVEKDSGEINVGDGAFWIEVPDRRLAAFPAVSMHLSNRISMVREVARIATP